MKEFSFKKKVGVFVFIAFAIIFVLLCDICLENSHSSYEDDSLLLDVHLPPRKVVCRDNASLSRGLFSMFSIIFLDTATVIYAVLLLKNILKHIDWKNFYESLIGHIMIFLLWMINKTSKLVNDLLTTRHINLQEEYQFAIIQNYKNNVRTVSIDEDWYNATKMGSIISTICDTLMMIGFMWIIFYIDKCSSLTEYMESTYAAMIGLIILNILSFLFDRHYFFTEVSQNVSIMREDYTKSKFEYNSGIKPVVTKSTLSKFIIMSLYKISIKRIVNHSIGQLVVQRRVFVVIFLILVAALTIQVLSMFKRVLMSTLPLLRKFVAMHLETSSN